MASMSFKRRPKIYDEESLYEYAVAALGRQMRTVAEIKRLMRNRVATQPEGNILIEMVVLRLKAQRYLNDPLHINLSPAKITIAH